MSFKTKLLLCAYIGVICVACNSQKEKESQSPIKVNSALAIKIEDSSSKEFSFISKPFRESDLSFRISGPVNKFNAYAGNYYRKGQVIAEIDSRDFIIRNERANAIYRQAKAEYERIKILFEKNNVSASAYEKANADYISAKTALNVTTNELIDTKLRAPFDGYVGEVYIEKFQEVKATQPILTFVDLNQLKIEAYVNQDIAIRAEGLKEVSLHFDALLNKKYSAQVIDISKNTTRNNISYLLTATLQNSKEKLPAGMSGKINFNLDNLKTSCIAIPQTAICHNDNDGDFVWIIDSNTHRVSKKTVTIGSILPQGYITIKNGVAENEIVATSQLRFLTEGMTVSTNN